MMLLSPTPTDVEPIVQQIDSLIRQLESLRRHLIVQKLPSIDLTEQLFASLGQGSWEEYDEQLDWPRFNL